MAQCLGSNRTISSASAEMLIEHAFRWEPMGHLDPSGPIEQSIPRAFVPDGRF